MRVLISIPVWRELTCSRCDEIGLDGTRKPSSQVRSSYSHAMKMRAAMTYGFGQQKSRGTLPWHITEGGQWRGNPSVSAQVSRYMVSLRRRKVSLDHAAGENMDYVILMDWLGS